MYYDCISYLPIYLSIYLPRYHISLPPYSAHTMIVFHGSDLSRPGCFVIHPVRITRIRCPRFVPRVGLRRHPLFYR